ncbi:hypothetical protein [Staphylococcus epidermidis]|uniref:hypothetical protein n=1 Tax=Staphylococcus epidermidis TaxID=1282 RepID=UPI0011A689C1|nr:hypothetical protein [Staphylococcus epidermidis]
MRKNKFEWKKNEKRMMLGEIEVRIDMEKAKMKMIKGKKSLKIIKSEKEEMKVIVKRKIMMKIDEIKRKRDVMKVKSDVEKEEKVKNESV